MIDILSIDIFIRSDAVPTARLYAVSFSERMPLLSLTGYLKGCLLKYPAPAFSLCCKSIALVKLPDDAIKSIIQDCTCLPAPLHCAGQSALAFSLHLIYC